MRLLIPCTNKLFNLGLPLVLRCKVGDFQPLTVQNAEPLCDLMHPRAMHGREGYDKSRRLGEPLADLWPLMGADMVTHEMKHRDVLINLAVQLFRKGQAFLLPFACVTPAIDPSGTGIQGRAEMEGTGTSGLVFRTVGQVLGLGRQGGMPTGPRLSGGLLIQ